MDRQMQVRKSITAEIRKEIISKHQSGTSVSKPRAEYGMAKSTTCSIHKNKDELKSVQVAMRLTKSL